MCEVMGFAECSSLTSSVVSEGFMFDQRDWAWGWNISELEVCPNKSAFGQQQMSATRSFVEGKRVLCVCVVFVCVCTCVTSPVAISSGLYELCLGWEIEEREDNTTITNDLLAAE